MATDPHDVPAWAQAPDLQRPNIARVYDYMLGGSHNFAVDREFADQVKARLPGVVSTFAGNRAFLRRAVRYCVGQGVTQFLDLGSGIPTMGSVHEVARGLAPDATVAYVDHEPVAVAYSEHILGGLEGVSVSGGDLRDPDAVLASPEVRRVLDFDRPVAVLMVAVLHFVPDSDDPAGILARYRRALVPGSLLAITHGSDDLADPASRESVREIERLYRSSSSPLVLRDRQAIGELLVGFTPVDPGIVDLPRWRPEPGQPDDRGFGGALAVVARRD